MAIYLPSDEVNDDKIHFPLYTVSGGVTANYNFNTAGYAANDPLTDLTKGEVKIYISTDPNFGSYATVGIAGVPTVANGLTMKRSPSDNTGAYFVWNLPSTPNATYYIKAVLRKTNEANRVTTYWQHSTSR